MNITVADMNTIEETLWEGVTRTHALLVEKMTEHFAVSGNVGQTHYVPELVPVYRDHRQALEKLLEAAYLNLNLKPRDNCYYLGIRQLEQCGRRAKANSEVIPGIPELPPLERIFTS